MKHIKKFNENKTEITTDLEKEIIAYLKKEYSQDWWDQEFQNRACDYVSQEDYIGEGTEDEPEFEDECDYYSNHCMVGTIEYDLMGEIEEDLIEKFNLGEFSKELGDIVNDYMMGCCADWYDKFVFQKSTEPYISPSEKMFGKPLDTSSWYNE